MTFMKRKLLTALTGVIFLIALSLQGLWAEETHTAQEAFHQRASAKALPVAKALMETLEGRLVEAMAEGGPVAAIEVCQEQALVLTETVRKEKDIAYLKRIGVRIRNPENAPDAAERRALKHFLQNGGKKGQFPADWVDTVELPDGSKELRYYKAIPMEARCLSCHGPETLMPEMILDAINKRYPDDKARGFEQGELRGLLVVGLKSFP